MAALKVEALVRMDESAAREILEIQKRAYRVEADLIGFDEIPPLNETIERLLALPLQWLVIRLEGNIAAATGFTIDECHDCDIDRLMVAPEHFGKGCGTALVSALQTYPRVYVSTGTRNLPARNLYEKLGFSAYDVREVAPGITVTAYEWTHLDAETPDTTSSRSQPEAGPNSAI